MPATRSGSLRLLSGALIANLLGWFAVGFYAWMFRELYQEQNALPRFLFATIYPNLLLVPMAMGVVAAYFWGPLGMRIWGYLLGALLTVAICIAGSYFFLKEGAICLVIVSPVLWLALFAGSLIGRVLFKNFGGKVQLTIVPLLLLAIIAEGRIASERTSVVTDRVVVKAAPAEVWKHVVAFPPIANSPNYWLNEIGLPAAAETTCEGEFVGARRACIFSNGVVLKETVAELEPQRRLTFDIVEQPRDPELLGHLTLHRGEFELQPNADGSTTLIGRSWYTLHVRPNWYFDWWTRDITRHVHQRVMAHIKELSEAAR